MVSTAVQSFLRHGSKKIEYHKELFQRGVRVDELKTTLILAPQSGILKDILAGNFNLNPDDDFVFVLPPELEINGEMFNGVEFPIYYSAFLQGNLPKGKSLQIVCTKDQESYMTKYLERTLMGPDLSDTPFSDPQRETRRKIAIELAPKDHNGNVRPLSDYVKFSTFNDQGDARVYTISGKGNLLVRKKINRKGEVSGYDVIHETPEGIDLCNQSLIVNYRIPETPLKEILFLDEKSIQINRFGFAVTCFGNSTGFDPYGYNTSFAVWMGGQGIIIDPSIRMLQAMDKLGLTNEDLPFVVLTHCHEDHDGGVLKLIKQGKKFNLIASKEVYSELMEKAQNSMGSVNWIELPVNQTTNLTEKIEIKFPNGEVGHIGGWENIHPIPTNGLFFEYKGKTFAHSGDTLWGKENLKKFKSKGILTKDQAHEHQYRMFNQDGSLKFDLVTFESGGGAIHTDVASIAEAVHPKYYDRVYTYHASQKVVVDSPLPHINLYETVVIAPPTEKAKKKHFLHILKGHPYLSKFSETPEFDIRWMKHFGKINIFKKGDTIISPEDGIQKTMHIVLTGQASVIDSEEREIAKRGPMTAIGDWGSLLETPPSARVVASSLVVSFEFDPRNITTSSYRLRDMRNDAAFLRSHSGAFEEALAKLGMPLRESMTILLRLKEHLHIEERPPGGVMYKKGEEVKDLYFIQAGSIELYETQRFLDSVETRTVATYERGSIVGKPATQKINPLHNFSAKAGENGAKVLAINSEEFSKTLRSYPGLEEALLRELKSRGE